MHQRAKAGVYTNVFFTPTPSQNQLNDLALRSEVKVFSALLAVVLRATALSRISTICARLHLSGLLWSGMRLVHALAAERENRCSHGLAGEYVLR